MLNITTLADILNGVSIFWLLWLMQKRRNLTPRGEMIKTIFLVLTILFFISSAPLAVTSSAILIAAALAWQHTFLMLAASLFVISALKVWVKESYGALLKTIFLAIGLGLSLFTLLNLRPIVWQEMGGFLFFRADFPIWVRLVDATLLIFAGIFSGLALIRHAARAGLEAKGERWVGAGILFLSLAPLLTYGLGATNSALVIFLGSVVAIPAYFIIYYGATR